MSAHMTEDQTLLQDAAERYLRDSYDFNQRRERIAGGVYSDPGQWQAFAEMGWLALPVLEEFGGLGMGTREMAILAELCGQLGYFFIDRGDLVFHLWRKSCAGAHETAMSEFQ